MTLVNIPALAHSVHPVVQITDGQAITTSLEVARVFGKQHAHVMRDIRALREQLPVDHQSNFGEMVVENQIGSGAVRKDPAYHLTRDGFTLLAMGFTGKRALAFKLAYIDAFNRMEVALREQAVSPIPTAPTQKHGTEQAYSLAMQTANQVADKVFKVALSGNPASDRWVVIISGNDTKATVVDPRAVILTPEEVVEGIKNGDVGAYFTYRDLVQLVQAALERIKRYFDKTVPLSSLTSIGR